MQPIIDSHVHFWNPGFLRYGWLDDLPVLNHPHLPADLPDSGDNWQLGGLVFVQADCLPAQALDEVRWVTELAGQDARIRGIVAHAPLEHGADAALYLDALHGNPLVKGVRRLIQSEPSGFSTTPSFISGVKLLQEYGYSFDLCIRHSQLPDVIQLVAACPNVAFVLDHIGKPSIATAQLDPWRADLARLAQFPNVMCKLSGLVTEASLTTWQPSDLMPYLEHVISTFSAERLMFGSDWPVLRLATTYPRWVSVVQQATAGFTTPQRDLFWYQNAARFYRL